MTTVLLTGGGGLLGKVVLETLLRTCPDAEVVVLLRGDAAARLERILASPCLRGLACAARTRVRPLAGDLAQPGAGLSSDDRARIAAEVTHVIHCAATVAFDLSPRDAVLANVATALEALGLARACRRPCAMVAVSTAYVATPAAPLEETLVDLPDDPRRLYEEALAGRAPSSPAHPNTYTFAKCLGEHMLALHRGDVRLTLVRPSIISACLRHPFEGWIDSAAALAGFVALYGSGRLRTLHADPQTLLDVMPCDEVADRVVAAALAPPPAGFGVRNAVAGRAHSLRIRDCAEAVRSVFGVRPLHYAPEKARDARQAAFAHFMHHTYDFRTSLPLGDHFSPDLYLRTLCEGVRQNLVEARHGRSRGR